MLEIKKDFYLILWSKKRPPKTLYIIETCEGIYGTQYILTPRKPLLLYCKILTLVDHDKNIAKYEGGGIEFLEIDYDSLFIKPFYKLKWFEE